MNVVFSRYLAKPLLVRERFSGGVNNSAQERNKARVSECSMLYQLGDTLFVPEFLRDEFERRLSEVTP